MILFWKLHWPKGRTAVSLVGFNLLYFKKKKQGCRKKLQGHGPLSWLGVAWLGMTVNFVISSVGGMAKSKKHSNRAHGTGHCTMMIIGSTLTMTTSGHFSPQICVFGQDQRKLTKRCNATHVLWIIDIDNDKSLGIGKKVMACYLGKRSANMNTCAWALTKRFPVFVRSSSTPPS